jgi:excisionase family DNA binding protein
MVSVRSEVCQAVEEANMALVMERLTVSVEEAAKLLGISRGSAYLAARTGQLPTIRVGKRLIVPVRSLEKMLESAGGQGEGEAAGDGS